VRIHRPEHPTATSDGWALEHRLVAWDAEILTDLEQQIHHRDGDRTNNDPANLVAMTAADHSTAHGARRRLDPEPFVAMRSAGMTLPEIAEATGCNSGTVWRVVARWVAAHPVEAERLGLSARLEPDR
jgi:hypothetical protein